MSTGLEHISEGQIHESAMTMFNGSKTFGPLKIEYSLDTSVPQLSFQVYLAGVYIGGGTIGLSNPCKTIGGSAGGFKAEVGLCLDAANDRVTYKVEVCVPIWGCTDYKGVLISW